MKETVLVTGGTGFVGIHIILQLMQQGYSVRTTVRSLTSTDKIIDTLNLHGVTSFDNISFFEADLLKDDNWSDIMEGCDYVLSVASPVFFEHVEKEEEMMRPAIEGIERILRIARDTGVKRVVMTSNFGAVGFSNKDVSTITTEEHWTNPNERGLSVYEKSKLLAERAAWDFINREGKGLEFTTINPVAILGPTLSGHVSGSFMIIENLLDGSLKPVPNIPLNIVDVRDVADLHIRAMIHPNAKGHRFIASADGQISMPEMAKLLKSRYPTISSKVSTKIMPNFIVSIASLFNETAREGALFLKINRNVSNDNARDILGWEPTGSNEDAIIAAVDSMIQYEKREI